MLKIDFRFLLEQGPRCDRFARLSVLTSDGWRELKEVQYNDYDRMWIPNKEHAVLALKAYAAYLYAPEEYPAAYQAFQSEFTKGKAGRGEHQVFGQFDEWLPKPDMSGADFFACEVELADQFPFFGATGAGTIRTFAADLQNPPEAYIAALQGLQSVFEKGETNPFCLIGPPGTGRMREEDIEALQKFRSQYLATLLDLPQDTPSDEVWKAYRQARAQKMGLPLDISEEELLRAEFFNREKRLTIKQLLDCYHDRLRLRPQ